MSEIIKVYNEVTYHKNMVDFVKCCNCETYMLIDVGEEKCPFCKTEGTLAWVDTVFQEVSVDYIEEYFNGKEYEIIKRR